MVRFYILQLLCVSSIMTQKLYWPDQTRHATFISLGKVPKNVFFLTFPNMDGWGGWFPNRPKPPNHPPKTPQLSRMSPFVFPNLTKNLWWVGGFHTLGKTFRKKSVLFWDLLLNILFSPSQERKGNLKWHALGKRSLFNTCWWSPTFATRLHIFIPSGHATVSLFTIFSQNERRQCPSQARLAANVFLKF